MILDSHSSSLGLDSSCPLHMNALVHHSRYHSIYCLPHSKAKDELICIIIYTHCFVVL